VNNSTQSSVLIVDDQPANLEILAQMLKDRGHKPRPVPSGRLAIRAAELEQPDLILMDINMPDMDGFETCRRMKHFMQGDVPVLFISARTDTFDKVQAFKAGGVDYITKPFDLEEVNARVETHLQISRLQRELSEKYDQLQSLEQVRDNLVHMVVHDMRSPLAIISMALRLLESQIGESLEEEDRLDLDSAMGSTEVLLGMVDNLLDLSRMESGSMPINKTVCDLGELVEATVEGIRKVSPRTPIVIKPVTADLSAHCDERLIIRVITNLVSNAVKFSPGYDCIDIRVDCDDSGLNFSVTDKGPGISPEDQIRVFEKFAQVNPSTHKASTGLGLTFCRLAMDAHQGEIGVESQLGRGSRFWFRLPHIN
jgi:two-component system sensor histidine kinase/response regulator